MKIKSLAGIAIIAVIFSGCISSSLNYTPPTISKGIVTEKVVEQSYDKTWNSIIDNLTDDSFVINNMNKDSGFINISFSTNLPSTYVDCGNWKGHFKNLRGEQHYNFKGSDSARFSMSMGTGAGNVISTKSLSGRINILLKTLDNKKQKLKVNVKYILKGQNKSQAFHLQYPNYENWDVIFSSKQSGRNMTGGQTECQTNGILESKILNYI